MNTLAIIWSDFWSAIAARVFPEIGEKQSRSLIRARVKSGPLQRSVGELLRCEHAREHLVQLLVRDRRESVP